MIAVLLALLQTAAPPAPPAPPPLPWTPVTRTDAASGQVSVSAATVTADRSARLVVRCDRAAEPVVSIQMRTKAGLAAAPDHVVSVSVDGGAPIEVVWEFPGIATMNREVGAITRLTLAMSAARSITVTTLDGTTPVSFSFAGPGSGSGIKDVLTACGYELGVVPAPTKAPGQK